MLAGRGQLSAGTDPPGNAGDRRELLVFQAGITVNRSPPMYSSLLGYFTLPDRMFLFDIMTDERAASNLRLKHTQEQFP